MKSMIVKELKELGIRKIGGIKIEAYSFYELCGAWTKFFKNKNLK